jgi:hypothetical protein
MGKMEFEFPANQDAWDLEEELLYLLDGGMVETCGENEDGEVLIRVTEKGIAYMKTLKALDD